MLHIDGMGSLLEGLNDRQREAASHVEGPLLILAGAGSGKTRVITHRIAWLVEEAGVAPSEILAVTFTNKAAGEMRSRVAGLLGPRASDIWISTFHSAGVRMLREHGEAAGIGRGFVIYDDADTLALLKRVLKDGGYDDALITPRFMRSRIDYAKSCGLGPDDPDFASGHPDEERVRTIFRRYQAALHASGAVDFGDLLAETVAMLRDHPKILEEYRRRLHFLMVDEFQDTSPVQYDLVKLLAGKSGNLAVVGDDDQSIYGWRGADVRNILSFEADFPNARVVRLEQSYRSTQIILDAAHAVISKSTVRKEKRLWTERTGGEPLEVLSASDEIEEARLVAARIEMLSREVPRDEIAILYRTNAMSRVLEDALRAARIPYQVVRGRSFYDRAEIKDLTSYLRLAVNPDSDADLLRVINKPRRGIGRRSVDRLRLEAARRENGASLWSVLKEGAPPDVGSRPAAKMREFAGCIGDLHDMVREGRPAREVVHETLYRSGLVAALEAEGTEEAREKLENTTELLAVAEQREQHGHTLIDLLDQMALIGDADDDVAGERVALMTLHSAKGLEFDVVVMVGMEEMTLPHARVFSEGGWTEDEESLAEERRLCYVGFTRARSRLLLGLARSRWVMGSRQIRRPSRFLEELPPELVRDGRSAWTAVAGWRPGEGAARVRAARPEVPVPGETVVDYSFDQRPPDDEGTAPRPGARVWHQAFGEGEIREVDGRGPDARLVVRFEDGEVKKVLARYLELMW